MKNLIKDPHFKVEVLSATPRPNLVCYLAMHQDYSENDVYSELDKLSLLSDQELGTRLVRHCVSKLHMGPLEHPVITFNLIGFPHSVIVQARTHRICTFDVQSNRYTSKRLLEANNLIGDISVFNNLSPKQATILQKYFYFRPVGYYVDREGNKYEYTEIELNHDMITTAFTLNKYAKNIEEKGYAPEHARDMLCYNFRQHAVCTFNARSLLHFLDMRTPQDAQLEIRTLAHYMYEHLTNWMPELAEWYEKNRYGRNRLAP